MSWEDFCKINEVQGRFANVHISKCDLLPEHIVTEGLLWCQKPQSLVIWGEPGRGKTHFMYALLREAIRLYTLGCCRWFDAENLDEKLLEEIHKFSSNASFVKKLTDIEILFINDWGIDKGTERAERDNYRILNKRWEKQYPTIISTNYSPEQIEKNYGARIFSRLKDSKWISFEGLPDLRGRGA